MARRSFAHDGSDLRSGDRRAGHRGRGAAERACWSCRRPTCIRRWRVDVSGALRLGRERDRDHSSAHPSARRRRGRRRSRSSFPISAGQQPDPATATCCANQQCDFGWDWNIALGIFGLSGAIRLEPEGPRIGDIIVTQAHRPGRGRGDAGHPCRGRGRGDRHPVRRDGRRPRFGQAWRG